MWDTGPELFAKFQLITGDLERPTNFVIFVMKRVNMI